MAAEGENSKSLSLNITEFLFLAMAVHTQISTAAGNTLATGRIVPFVVGLGKLCTEGFKCWVTESHDLQAWIQYNVWKTAHRCAGNSIVCLSVCVYPG